MEWMFGSASAARAFASYSAFSFSASVRSAAASSSWARIPAIFASSERPIGLKICDGLEAEIASYR